jgi:hypothetical protein
MVLVDYTTVLDGPNVSVKGLTQQGVESVVEMTTMSGVTNDGLDDPSFWHLLIRKALCCGPNCHHHRRLRQDLFQ